MGLRFHKSINLGGGFKVNLSGSGVGFSWGVPGFRVSKTATGKTRRTISVPGTGISYVSESGSKSGKTKKSNTAGTIAAIGAAAAVGAAKSASKSAKSTKSAKPAAKQTQGTAKRASEKPAPQKAAPVSYDALKTIHRTADEAVDWKEIAAHDTPTDEMYDADFWSYCHELAPKILAGDIDAYLRAIQDMNPYDDLLDLGGNFLFGTDRSDTMEVEFTAKSAEVMPTKRELGVQKYFDLLQDYVCSVAVRTARDTFALLPVDFVKIHAVDDGKLILSVCFDRSAFTKIHFGLSDPSDIVEKFPHNMDFNITRGFAEVEEI